MPTTIRLGTCSPATQATTAETLSLLARTTHRAAAKGIDLLLLPEAFLGGYPRGTHFGCVIGNRTAAGRDEYLRYFRGAVDLGDTVGDGAGAGPAWVRRELPADGCLTTDRHNGDGDGDGDGDGAAAAAVERGDGTREELERIAKESGVFLVVGCIEKAGGSLYCAQVYVCPKLGCVGKRRKVQPTGCERLCWAAGSPATLRAVSTVIRGVRINLAAAICWENYMPMLRQALYAQNINLYLAPTADGRDAWLSLVRTIGTEGRCFVVSSNMCVRGEAEPDKELPHAQAQPLTTTSTTVSASANTGGSSSTARARRRRNSCVTEDGFEIALPSPTSTSRSPTHTTRSRRRSVFDDEGNEIVLCEAASASAVHDEPPTPIPEENGETAGVRQSGRRQSVLDEDGNEIVLCCSGGGDEKDKSREDGGGEAARDEVPKPESAMHSSNELRARGGSSIVSPFGDVLAGPQWEDDEGLIYADVDFEDCIRGRLDLDVAGSYARNDSFKFSVEGLDLSPLPY